MAKKLYIQINSKLENGASSMFVVSSEKSFDTRGNFQLRGDIYKMPGMKKTQNIWFWGIDPNTKKLRRDPKSGEPRAWVKFEWARGCNCELARAVQAAYQKGVGVLTPEQISEMSGHKPVVAGKKPAVTVVEPSAATAPAMPQIMAEDKAAIEADLAMLDSETKKPVDRLKNGDPLLFVELGATSEQAEKWVAWIRENPGKVSDIADVKKIRGIGRVNYSKLVKAWGEKFE